ncbi:M56 family metallopeptidase [Dyella tabacisoli]|uniref:Peptidase M56 n=1 Tax=Dyella tabacisoli TaxID=2282381 RepID=A0A369UM54_9GAMM|nr:M56 family metallopeptidase [Dyella tabacisoli]RDD80680.1 peptidase M56 [Dyella tabacisoli]
MNTLDTLADTLLIRLIWTSAQAALLIGALWLLGRWLPRLSPAIRSTLWWLVAAQLIVGLVVSTPLELPLLSPSADVATVITSTENHVSWMAEPTTLSPISATVQQAPIAPQPSHWRGLIVGLWMLGVLVQLPLATRQWRLARTVLRESVPLDDESLQASCKQQAQVLALRRCPRLRVSHAIASPQVMGLWRPTVLLPAGQALTAAESAMALTHELAHLQRGDLWLGWVPAIAQRLFFFHPLVAWAMREYALNREAACDAQVLQKQCAVPQDYGRLLLRLGVVQPMHSGLAGASPTFQNLKRRLMMLQQTVNDTKPRSGSWLLVALVALAGVLPYRVTAAHADPADTNAAGISVQNTDKYPPPAPPPPPPEPVAPLPPPPPPEPPSLPRDYAGNRFRGVTDINLHSNASRGFALFDGELTIISGTNLDLDSVKRLHRTGDPMVWFRRDGKAYVIHDATLVQRARDAYAPVNKLELEQSHLASEQSKLAAQESGLAMREGELARRQGEMQRRDAEIDSRQVTPATDAYVFQRKSELEALRNEQTKLNGAQQPLAKQQAELSKQQAELSKRQSAESDRAEKQMDKVLDEAIAKGVAQAANTQ